jgi:hypothetical protein
MLPLLAEMCPVCFTKGPTRRLFRLSALVATVVAGAGLDFWLLRLH